MGGWTRGQTLPSLVNAALASPPVIPASQDRADGLQMPGTATTLPELALQLTRAVSSNSFSQFAQAYNTLIATVQVNGWNRTGNGNYTDAMI